jgi:hypothetical protein
MLFSRIDIKEKVEHFVYFNFYFIIKVHYKYMVFFACLFVCLMVFNATFNNISVLAWWLALLVEETGGPGENH